ncbi:Glp-like protein [Mycena sanguinolenta]|uniref:Glp-like protein n=1 Tax=Mycena sanguinolenta TaxID=230812 RepID=A0A8H6ZBQ6_9AGAR|nr:Glp-like protein [Mycena sanguinolenta]
MTLTVFSALLFLASTIGVVHAESHTVSFDNRCGFGTPQLIKGGSVLTTTSYTSSGAFDAAIAYLQTGDCLFNGENCTLLELTMTNPVATGGGSSADISLIPPHAFSVPARIEFYGGCDGIGTTCDSQSCTTAFRQPDDTWVQIACQDNNVNLLITFCPDGSSSSSSSSSTIVEVKTTADSRTTQRTSLTVEKTTSTMLKVSPSTTVSSRIPSSAPSSTGAPTCKRKHAERRAINAHRKRGNKGSFH